MNFNFYLQNAARNNVVVAQIREQTRMACIAYGLSTLGHEVRICSASSEFEQSNRWDYFKHLYGGFGDAIRVLPAEDARYGTRPDIGIKCSVGCKHDDILLNKCGLLVAHEHNEKRNGAKNLLPVPFICFDGTIEYFIEQDLFNAYLNDDLETIRSHFSVEKTKQVCFAGVGHYDRQKMFASLQNYCEIILKDKPVMISGEYLKWASSFKAGLSPSGDTPKANRFSDLVVLGLATIAPPCSIAITPPLNRVNSILLKDWNDIDGLENGLGNAESIVAEADKDYRAGWSPMGQARQILELLKC
ncbi:MAG: hypothetical protein ACUZ8H_07355 [Candidatus Anammoxibacter sp.]